MMLSDVAHSRPLFLTLCRTRHSHVSLRKPALIPGRDTNTPLESEASGEQHYVSLQQQSEQTEPATLTLYVWLYVYIDKHSQINTKH